MHHSLTIAKELFDNMSAIFSASSTEEGFLLGCTAQIDHITDAVYLPTLHSGQNFYTPDPLKANEIIQDWSTHGVCFCGFVHSHITGKPELSQADLQFAERLLSAYKIPVLWFGLALVSQATVRFRFYSVMTNYGITQIAPISLFRGIISPRSKNAVTNLR